MRRRRKGKGEERWRDWDEVRRNVTIAVDTRVRESRRIGDYPKR